MAQLRRATPTLINVAYGRIFMWDGRDDSLEKQALGPIESDKEMHGNVTDMIGRIAAISGYKELFSRAYPGAAVDASFVAKALANFERTILSANAPFDRWQGGDPAATTESAKRGFALFLGEARCNACHQGFNFTDDGFHNIGVKTLPDAPLDEGRYEQRKVKSMRGAFKTPTLRDIALTSPYMHNGIYETLEEVVEHYDRGGDVLDNLDPTMSPLKLEKQDKADLVAFLKSLTGPAMTVTLLRLPQSE